MSNLVYRDAKGNSLFPTPHEITFYLILRDLLGPEAKYYSIDETELKFLSWMNHIDIDIEDLRRDTGKLISEYLIKAIPLIGD